MTWTPKYSAVFEEFFVLNTLTIIERDFKSALDYFYPEDDYPDFAERSLGMQMGNEFPGLVIDMRSNQSDASEDAASILEVMSIDLHIGVTGESATDSTTKILRYVRTLDSVLRSATNEDYTAGLTSQKFFGLVRDVSHSYLPIQNQSNYFRPAIVNLALQIHEA